jgi:beta-RFAP synthase
MAVSQGLALLAGDRGADCVDLARRVGRGLRSAVGVHGFGRGGLIVDGGKTDPEGVGTLICRFEFPAEWRFLLVTPLSTTGISGDAERDALQRLPPIAAQEIDRLCGVLIRKLLPAVIESDFEACADALCEYGGVVGQRYAALQGGIFASRQMEELAARLRHEGIRGVGQTSWGPTIFALRPSAGAAESLREDLSRDAHCEGCELRIVAPLNTGASIEVSEDSTDAAVR